MNLDELAVQGQVVADRVLERTQAAGKGYEWCVGKVSGPQSSLKGCWDTAAHGDSKLVKYRGRAGKDRGGGWGGDHTQFPPRRQAAQPQLQTSLHRGTRDKLINNLLQREGHPP